jgi:hypothetical protein
LAATIGELMNSHEEVVKKFASQLLNSRTKKVQWSGNNIFCDDNVIYSYGRHFPLAKYLGLDGKKRLFIKNADKYSSSTSCHQSIVGASCYGPEVSRTLLANWGIDFYNIKKENIVCFRVSSVTHTHKDIQTNRYYDKCYDRRWGGEESPNPTGRFFVGALEDQLVENEWFPPKSGEFFPYYKRDKNRIVGGHWFVLGAVVICRGQNFFLCSHDKYEQAFVTPLKGKPKNIEEAFKLFLAEQEEKSPEDRCLLKGV